MNLARLLSAESEWAKAKSYLERSLHYTRGDRSQIAETLGWLGSVHLQLGETAEGQARLEQVIDHTKTRFIKCFSRMQPSCALPARQMMKRLSLDTLRKRWLCAGFCSAGRRRYPRLSMRGQILRLGGELAADAWYPAG